MPTLVEPKREYTKAEKLAMIQNECRTNLRSLCRGMLDMDKWESPLHDDLALFLKKPAKQKLILMPRGHLKTSIVTVGYTIQTLLRDPNKRILINNAVWDNARAILNQISDYLTYKSKLPLFFGQFINPKVRWTTDLIEIAQRTKATSKEASITTGGLESAKTGLHFDLIIHDDLVERNNVGTKEQIQKVITFYRDSLDLLDPGGEMIIVGTRWALGDLYGHIMDNEMSFLNGREIAPDERVNWRKHVGG